MIQHPLPVRLLHTLFRAVCWQPSRLVRRHDADHIASEYRQPRRESLVESLTAHRPDRRMAQGSFGYLRLDVCDH